MAIQMQLKQHVCIEIGLNNILVDLSTLHIQFP